MERHSGVNPLRRAPVLSRCAVDVSYLYALEKCNYGAAITDPEIADAEADAAPIESDSKAWQEWQLVG
jgi:hypothetical protein